ASGSEGLLFAAGGGRSGLGPGRLEPEQVARSPGECVFDLSLSEELATSPYEQTDPTDDQAACLEGAAEARGGLSREVHRRVEVHLQPVVLLAEEDGAEADVELIDVWAG